MSSNAPFKVAAIQQPPVFLDRAASLERAGALIAEAAERGARVIAFPETWLPGYPVWLDEAPGAALWDHPPAKALFGVLYDNAVELPGPELEILLQAAARARAHVVLGVHERVGSTLYNTTLLLDPDGARWALHRKLMPTYSERMLWGRGDGSTLATLQTPWGRLGSLICWEHWMPLARAAMHARDELLHVAQWPQVKEMNLVASRHYAFEGGCFVIAAGAVLTRGEALAGLGSATPGATLARELLGQIPGTDDTLLLHGGSAIIAPDGELLAGPLTGQPAILIAEIDPAHAVECRMALDTDGHYARPDVFRLIVDETPRVGVSFERES